MSRILLTLMFLVFPAILNAGEIIMVTANWCHPCQLSKPAVTWYNKQHTWEQQVRVFDVTDVHSDLSSEIIRTYGVKSLPTFIVFREGKEVLRHTGAVRLQHLYEMNRLAFQPLVRPLAGVWMPYWQPLLSFGVGNTGVGIAVPLYRFEPNPFFTNPFNCPRNIDK